MSAEINLLQVSRFLRVYDDAAAQEGIKISIGFDFNEYVTITQATPTKRKTYPTFRPDRSPIESGDGYWVIGVDDNNDVVLTEAARLFHLRNSNFAELLESLKAFYAEPATHAHPKDRCTCTAPSAKKITGKVAYQGDRWVRRDLRGQGVPKILTGIARGVSFAMWAPDFVCGLVAGRLLDKGSVHGYAHHERGSTLHLVEEDIMDDEWLTWLTDKELRSLVASHDQVDPLLALSVPSGPPSGA